jgi:hypothetical protein
MDSSMVYGPRPAAMRARRMQAIYVPQSGATDVGGGTTIRINIGTAPAQYLLTSSTVLKFSVKNAVAYNLDGSAGASAFIETLRVYHGANMLEEVTGMGRLCSILNDVTRTPGEQGSIGSLTAGQSGIEPAAATTPSAAEVNAIARVCKLVRTPAPDGLGAATRTFTIPLVSGVIGSLARQAFPLTAATAADLRVEIVLAAEKNPVQNSSGTDPEWTASDFSIITDILELSPESEALVVASTGGQFQMNTQSYRQSTAVVAEDNTRSSILLPFRFSSMNSILLAHYKQTVTNSFTNAYTSRSRANLTDYYFRIGNSHVPANPVALGAVGVLPAEGFVNLLKAFHINVGNIQIGNSCTSGNFNKAEPTTTHGTFCIAQELEAFGPGSSSKVESGVNTLSQTVFFEGTYATVPNAMDVAAWAFHDVRLDFVSGTCRAMI